MKHKITGAILAMVFGLAMAGGAQPVSAASDIPEETFRYEESGSTSTMWMGQNLFLAGNNVINNTTSRGILFSTGNQLDLQTKSDYAFVAGNIINYNAETEKDLFVAGNAITIQKDARIGRDVFAAGNNIKLEANIPGAFSATGATITIRDAKINGNVDLAVDRLSFEGKVEISGKLKINSDASIDGLDNVSYQELERYEVVEYETTAADILVGKILSIAGIFITFVIIMAMFPGVNQRVSKELTAIQFGKDLLIGIVTLVFVPIIVIFLLISFIGAPAGIVLLVTYLVMLYVSQGYTGLWLGKMIIEKLIHGKINAFLELLIGVTLLTLLIMIPWIGGYIWLLSTLLGLGLFMQSIKPNRRKNISNPETKEAEIVNETETKSVKKASEKED